MSIYLNTKKFEEMKFEKESDFEDLIFSNSDIIFGKSRILISAKKKINAGDLGKSIPDGFLFDFTEQSNPKLVLLEVELEKHRFFDHIFPQITKFFAFLREGNKFQSDLTDTLYRIVDSDDSLRSKFAAFIGKKELYKFLKDIVENACDILIIIDGDKKEFTEIMDVYTDTWDKYVQIVKVQSFRSGDDNLIYLTPDIDNLKMEDGFNDKGTDLTEQKEDRPKYSEEFHLDGVSPFVKDLYDRIRSQLKSFKVNPQKYYISFINKANFAYVTLRKKKIRIVVTMPKNEVDKIIKSYSTVTPSEGVQRFYNCNCTEVMIDNGESVEEILELLTKASGWEYDRKR
jgi:predicted transport protein